MQDKALCILKKPCSHCELCHLPPLPGHWLQLTGKTAAWLFLPYSSVSFRAQDILGTSLFPATLGGIGSFSGFVFLWTLCRLRAERGKCQPLYFRPAAYGRRDSPLHRTHTYSQLHVEESCDAWGQHVGLGGALQEEHCRVLCKEGGVKDMCRR